MEAVQQLPACRVGEGAKDGIHAHPFNMQPYGCMSRGRCHSAVTARLAWQKASALAGEPEGVGHALHADALIEADGVRHRDQADGDRRARVAGALRP